MHALVCDDDSGTRLVLSRMLQRHVGCAVTECGDGVRALEAIARERFDLILLDIEMPAMTGIEIVETLRNAGILDRQPVVMITSDGRAEVVQHLLALGIADFIVKPLKADSLIEKLGRLRTRLGQAERAADEPVAP